MKGRARKVVIRRIIVQNGAIATGHSVATVNQGGRDLPMRILDRIIHSQKICDACKVQAAQEIIAAIAEDGGKWQGQS